MLQLKIDSMTCNHCISMVTKTIQLLQKDANIEADLTTQMVNIDSKLSEEDILDALNEAAYPATIAGSCCSM